MKSLTVSLTQYSLLEFLLILSVPCVCVTNVFDYPNIIEQGITEFKAWLDAKPLRNQIQEEHVVKFDSKNKGQGRCVKIMNHGGYILR